MVKYVVLAVLAVVTAIHLFDSWHDDAEKRRRTKPLLLILILIYYLTAANSYSFPLIVALITSWLGDILLMPKGNKWFAFGGISFLISHIMFIIVYYNNVKKVSHDGIIVWAVILAAAAYVAVSLAVIFNVQRTTPKVMVVPMYLYLLFNSTMNVFSLIQLMCLRSPAAVVAYIGAVLFFISDCSLYLVRYSEKKDIVFKHHFTVMLTYVLGELLITQGILMLG